MKAIYGIARHNIYAVYKQIIRYQDENRIELRVQKLGSGEQVKANAQIIMVPNIKVFLANLQALNASKAVVFVFDAVVKLEFLKPIQILDLAGKQQSFSYQLCDLPYETLELRLGEGLANREKIEVTHEAVDIIPTLLSELRHSLLKPILDFLYKVSNTDHRNQYQALIYTWIAGDEDIETLQNRLCKACGRKSTKVPSTITELLKHFETETAVNTRAAIREIIALRSAKKTVSYKKLSAKYKVEAFDLKYLLRAIRKAKAFIDYGDAGMELSQLFKQRKQQKAAKPKEQEMALA